VDHTASQAMTGKHPAEAEAVLSEDIGFSVNLFTVNLLLKTSLATEVSR
jgi:hypothetical protein